MSFKNFYLSNKAMVKSTRYSLLSLFVYLTFLNHSFYLHSEIDYLQKVKETFMYGSYQEQLSTLELYTKENLKGKDGENYLELLGLLIDQKPENTQVYMRLIDIILESKLEAQYPLLSDVLDKEFLESKFLGRLKAKLITKALYAIATLELSQYADLIRGFFTEEELNEGNGEILREAVFGMGVFKKPEDRKELITHYENIELPGVREEILKSIARFGNEQDVDFFKSVIYSEDTRDFLKWIAVVSLKEYPESQLAFNMLKSSLYNDSPDIRSRALYALSFFKREGVEEILIKASKEDNGKIRYQAISGLEQFNNDQVNNLLRYKMERDPEPSIKKKAKAILEKRGLIKEEAEKEKGKTKETEKKEETEEKKKQEEEK